MPLFTSMDPLRRRFCAWFAGLGLSRENTVVAATQDPYAMHHQRMIDDITSLVRETQRETGRSALGERVMAALAKVPRHRFVSPDQERGAYLNRPLPIGSGQTISQPFIVALMTDFMDVKSTDKVLEIGTGSGYQAAVLAELAHTVYTIEIIESLAREAAARFKTLGYRNIVAKAGDGYHGWPEHAPFDSIMVTAAARDIPQPLIDQLKAGGRLVIPIGSQIGGQMLVAVEKLQDGKISRRDILAVRFVPLTRNPSQ
jgi:protein-L-isoaspartate(D-aspartate) O-methyltransferase